MRLLANMYFARVSGTRALLLATLVGLLWSPETMAGARAPCTDPGVFEGAAVNALILPYRYTGTKRHHALSETGVRLTSLLQLEILFSMIKHGSVGATYLYGEPGGCDVNEVLHQVAERSGPRRLRSGHGLVVLWGRLYEEGNDIYVQSYMRFLRRETDEVLSFSLPGKGNMPLQFTARLPAQAITFAPRRLSQADLERIEKESQQSAVIRTEPDLALSGTPLSEWPSFNRFAYWVTEVRDDWMYIKSMQDAKGGWVRAHIDSADWALYSKMPELAYLDAVTGYLRYQTGREAEGVSPAPPKTQERVKQALTFYEKSIKNQSEPLPKAVGRAMQGMMLFYEARQSPNPQAALERMSDLFGEARRLLPYNAEARNLQSLGSIYLRAQKSGGETDIANLVKQLLETVAVEPLNKDVLANLEHLYGYIQTIPEQKLYSDAELQKRIERVKKVRAKINSAQ